LEELRYFNATPGEELSRYLSSIKKSQMVTAERIPAFPEPH